MLYTFTDSTTINMSSVESISTSKGAILVTLSGVGQMRIPTDIPRDEMIAEIKEATKAYNEFLKPECKDPLQSFIDSNQKIVPEAHPSPQLMFHNGFNGTAQISIPDGVLFGKIEYISDLVTYEAETVLDLVSEFEKAVDDYIESIDKPDYIHTVEGCLKGDIDVDLRVITRLDRDADAIVVYTEGANLTYYISFEHYDIKYREFVRLETAINEFKFIG
ncbi:hypothetical protein N9043_00610 [bacterium]|nr:hypothetical protein [bacterium]